MQDACYGVRWTGAYGPPFAHAQDACAMTEIALKLLPAEPGGECDAAAVGAAEDDWFQLAPLADGSNVLRWRGLCAFVVDAAGRQIAMRREQAADWESVWAYLLNHALAYALSAQGIETLHATALYLQGFGAIAVAGRPGAGKSTLAAAMIRQGAALISDDMLVLEEDGAHINVWPGAPRLKLFPEVASTVLGADPLANLNPYTHKALLALPRQRHHRRRAPLRAIYVLAQARPETLSITPMQPRHALRDLLASTFNCLDADRRRLGTLLSFAGMLAQRVPVLELGLPHGLERLPSLAAEVAGDARVRVGR